MKYGVFPIETYKDDRASRFFDLFPELSGQITVSIVKPNQFSGWHKHVLQYDKFFVAQGQLKVGIITPEGKVTEELLSADEPQTLHIPPHYWHCYHSMKEMTVLIYFLSRKHDETDEIRGTVDEIFQQYGYRISV